MPNGPPVAGSRHPEGRGPSGQVLLWVTTSLSRVQQRIDLVIVGRDTPQPETVVRGLT